MGKRLVEFGNDVTIFTSTFDGCEPETFRSGMRFLRKGGKYTVYREAREYVRQHSSEFDVIIDEINTVPFRIPQIVKNKPVVALIHQLARKIWFHETRFPISLLGYFVLEPFWIRGYKRIPTVTVSNSTKDDLVKLGFQRVDIVRNGLGPMPLNVFPEKEPYPVLVFVGRLVKSKHPDHAIVAFKYVKKLFPNAELWVLGDGYMKVRLEKNRIQGAKFFGRVSDGRKFELLRRAHVLLMPSVREGWGVSVIEANAMGTPAVGYDVPGLRDSIIQGVTGLLVRSTPDALAEGVMSLLRDPSLSSRLSANAIEWSKKFDWNVCASDFQSFLESVVTSWPDNYDRRPYTSQETHTSQG